MADIHGNEFDNILPGTPGADVIEGLGGADSLLGFAGEDELYGGDGNDTLRGGEDDDYLVGGPGSDVIDGGPGEDRVSYESSPFAVNVNLVRGTAQDGFGGVDTLSDIERITGSQYADVLVGDGNTNYFRGLAGNDTIIGGAGDNDRVEYQRDAANGGGAGVIVDLAAGSARDGFGNTDALREIEDVRGTYADDWIAGDDFANELQGEGGNDLLYGRGGNDYFNGGAGNDTFDGGAGFDTVAYDFDEDSLGSRGVVANLATGYGTDTFGGIDRFIAIESIVGSVMDDVLTGSAAANHLSGLAGNDSLYGGAGNDYLEPGSGADLIDGGADYDTLSYRDDPGGAGITVRFTAAGSGTVVDRSGATDVFTAIERVRGTAGDDRLIGGPGDQSLSGEEGNDYLEGGDGNDELEGGVGNDTLDASTGSVLTQLLGDFVRPGTGTNTVYGHAGLWAIGKGIDLSYDDVAGSGGIVVRIGALGSGTVRSAIAGVVDDTFSYAHYFIGTADADRFLRAEDDGRWFAFRGLAGNDTIIGSIIGTDQVDYARDAENGGRAGVTVNLATGIAIDGFGTIDTLFSIEDVRGTAGKDVLTGNTARNYLQGGAGDDVIFGGAGDDRIAPGTGADHVDGGDGFDTVEYTDDGIGRGLTVDLTAPAGSASGHGTIIDWTDAVDTLSGIEAVSGTNFADRFTGGTGNQAFYGGGGADTFRGGAGEDYFEGGAGDDLIDGEADFDTVSYYWDMPSRGIVLTQTTLVNATVHDGLGGVDTLRNVESVEGTNFGDAFYGGPGEHFFRGLGGSDTLTGGPDMAAWAAYDDTAGKGGSRGVNIDFVTGVAVDTFGDRDVLTGVTRVLGSEWADSIRAADALAYRFAGNDGDDTLTGADGNDTLDGGSGNDLLFGGAGDDIFIVTGLEDRDTVYGGSGYDTLKADLAMPAAGTAPIVIDLEAGRAGAIILASVENVDASGVAGMTLIGTFAANTLRSGAGADRLYGGGGADRLEGGSGSDTLDGGSGADTLVGGEGDDVYVVDDPGDLVVEVAGGGIDRIDSFLAWWRLPGFVENGWVLARGSADLVGNALDNLLIAGAGDNVLDGGAGTDTASYAFATAGVTVILGLGAQATGGSGTDTLIGIENLIGSAFDDRLVGDAGANALYGGAGADRLNGGAGADTMVGGDGNDIYNVDMAGDVVIETNADPVTGGIDRVNSGLSFYALGANIEEGRIVGTGAADLAGNARDNTLFAGLGNNVLWGGDGRDTASYAFCGAVTVNLGLAGGQATGGSGLDTLIGIENLAGSDFDDALIGDAGANRIEGGAGNDRIDGAGGADTLIGGDGNDRYVVDQTGDVVIETNPDPVTGGIDRVASWLAAYTLGDNVEEGKILLAGAADLTGNALDNTLFAGPGDNVLTGGAGRDTVSYAFGTAGVTVSLALAGAQATGGSGSDRLVGIENLAGSPFDDALTGDAGTNRLDGGAGRDTLDGGPGPDTLTGGADGDTYIVDDIGDLVIETDSFAATGGIDYVASLLSDYTLPDNVEQGSIIATGAANLTGNRLDNLLFAGTGDNILNGGGGTDIVSYAAANAGVTVSLLTAGGQVTGGSGTDTLIGIAYLMGSAFDDRLTGNAAANWIHGGSGSDTLDGGSGADTLVGGEGDDVYVVDDPGDLVVEVAGGGIDRIDSFLAWWRLPGFVENGWVLARGSADLVGNALDNLLIAGAGDNVLDGGAGTDTASYAFATAGVTVILGLGAQATGGSGTDTLIGIENLIGSAFDDRLVGDAGANALYGGAGADRLNGGAGADTMVGGDGNDIYNVDMAGDVVIETNADPVTGGIDRVNSGLSFYALGANIEEGRIVGTGAADLAGNARDNTLFAGLGNNVLWGGDGRDTASYAFCGAVTVNLGLAGGQATGGSGLDTLIGIENLAGSDFDDALIGDAGANRIEGGAGNDRIDGAGGADTLIGGDGNDRYVVDQTGDVVIETNPDPVTGGIDRVASWLAAYTLGDNVEEGKILLAGAADLTGNALDNTLFAGPGDNVLTGGAGRDTVSYAFGTAGVTVSLALAGAQATGGSGSDRLVGIENLAGSPFDDALTGDAGTNRLDGGAGRDTLDGGPGPDTLTGGADGDTFVFSFRPTNAADADTIADFNHGSDRLAFDRSMFAALATDQTGGLGAAQFHAGSTAATADDHLIYDQAGGRLYYDPDGSGAGEQILIATLLDAPALSAADVILF